MEFTVVPLSEEDREPVIDIFNYYVENSFAAFLEQKLPYEAFGMLVNLSQGFPAGAIRDPSGRTVGFGLLRFHNAMPAFSRTAEATYFIHPDYTGRGLGTLLLEFLTQIAAAQGVTNILASISSLNPGSIQFHKKKRVPAVRPVQKGRREERPAVRYGVDAKKCFERGSGARRRDASLRVHPFLF